jgi:phosphatidate cytidylyltransferase
VVVGRLGGLGAGRRSRAARRPVGLAALAGAVAFVSGAGRVVAGLAGVGFGARNLDQLRALGAVHDIGAYFAGRNFGKRKLAPSISPGKTWEGVIGGVVGVWLLGLAWLLWIDRTAQVDGASVFSHVRERLGWAGFFVVTAAIAGLSVVGDLFESLVKRAAGAKDSSRLLPGHGGVLDRIDALLPVLPAAMALASL